MDADRLAEIRARCDAATEGPWGWADGGSFGGWWLSHAGDPAEPTIAATVYGPIVSDKPVGGSIPNQDFIAHARADVPELVAAVEALQAAVMDEWGWGGQALQCRRVLGAAVYDALRAKETTPDE